MPNPVLTTWRRRPWLPILLGATIADVAVRFLLRFDAARTLPIEAAILGGAGALVLARSGRSGAPRWGELALAAVLGLGALRAVLWGVQVPVSEANLVVLAMGIICAAVLADRRLRTSAARTALEPRISGVPLFREPPVPAEESTGRRVAAGGAQPVPR